MTLGNVRHGSFAGGEAFGQGGDDVLVERLADGAGLFGAVEHGDALDGRRQRLQEVLEREGPHQADLQHADFLALRGEVVDRLVNRLGARAHHDDDALRRRARLRIGTGDTARPTICANLSIAFCTMVGQAR